MTVAFQCMFGILERWNNNQVTPYLSKPHELSYRFNIFYDFFFGLQTSFKLTFSSISEFLANSSLLLASLLLMANNIYIFIKYVHVDRKGVGVDQKVVRNCPRGIWMAPNLNTESFDSGTKNL